MNGQLARGVAAHCVDRYYNIAACVSLAARAFRLLVYANATPTGVFLTIDASLCRLYQ